MHDRLAEGIKFFNAGNYFEAHEVWEDMWRESPEPLRSFCQGLIHAAVGLHHLERNNHLGASAQIEKSLRKLRPYGDEYCGVDLIELSGALSQALKGKSAGLDQHIRINRNLR
jgi:hypothetical protein